MKIPLAKIGTKHRELTIPKDSVDHILKQEGRYLSKQKGSCI